MNVLFSQVAQSDLRGAHKLVEDIDVPRQFFCHGYDNADHVCVVCKNDGVVSDTGCSELLGLKCTVSVGLRGLTVEEEDVLTSWFVLLLLQLLHLLIELCRLLAQLLEGGCGRGHAGACSCLLFGWKKGDCSK